MAVCWLRASVIEPVGDLCRHAFLDLRTPAVDVDDAGEFGNAEQSVGRQPPLLDVNANVIRSSKIS